MAHMALAKGCGFERVSEFVYASPGDSGGKLEQGFASGEASLPPLDPSAASGLCRRNIVLSSPPTSRKP
jgi:hypothetical protein